MLLAAAVGLWLLRRAVWPGVVEGRRVCPGCGYDLRYSPTARCSECGRELRSEREGATPPRRWWLAAVGVVIALVLPVLVVQYRVREYGWAYYTRLHPIYTFFPDEIHGEWVEGEYRIWIYSDRRKWLNGARYNGTRALVTKRGEPVWRFEAQYITPGADPYFRAPQAPPRRPNGPLFDVDRDGVTEFVCQSSDGGNGGYQLTHVLRLGETLEEMNPHADDSTDDGIGYLDDLDGDGRVEAVGMDRSFQFFRTSHAGSAGPLVIWRFGRGRLEPSAELMAKPEPYLQGAEREALVRQLRGQGASVNDSLGDALYSPLNGALTRLIYSGQTREAWRLLDDAWPGTEAEKLEYVRELEERIDGSRVKSVLVEMGYVKYGGR
jgi:hypothetical protein